MVKHDRDTIQKVFIRVCKDSGFRLSANDAAILSAKILGIPPLDMWIHGLDIDVMERIAKGDHPVCM